MRYPRSGQGIVITTTSPSRMPRLRYRGLFVTTQCGQLTYGRHLPHRPLTLLALRELQPIRRAGVPSRCDSEMDGTRVSLSSPHAVALSARRIQLLHPPVLDSSPRAQISGIKIARQRMPEQRFRSFSCILPTEGERPSGRQPARTVPGRFLAMHRL